MVRRSHESLPDDTALALALAAGDPRGQHEAWQRFAPLVRGILRRTLGPTAEVEDATQEVFLRFYPGVRGLRDPSVLRSFVVGIAVRVARKELRRRWLARWLHLDEKGEPPEPPALPCDHEAREALLRFYRILDRMGGEGRLAFALRFVEGMELTEVARALGVSLATTKRRLARTVRRIEAAVGRDPALQAYVGHQTGSGRHGLADGNEGGGLNVRPR